MNIIITGASGFVGKNLSQYLEDNHHSVDKISLRNKHWSINKGADAVIHLAGKAHDTVNTSDENEYFKINTELTKKLFDQFLDSGIRDFFYFSSVKATADSVDTVLDENNRSTPATPYGKSKLRAENYILSQNIPQNKRVFIIRPCMIHGPGNQGNLNLLYKIVQKGIPWPLASFENKRSFLSIDNLNFLIAEMIENTSVPSGIYNFADDHPVSTNDLIRLIAASETKKPRMIAVSKKIILRFAKIGDYLRLPLNSERLKKLTENYVVSNQKVKNALKIKNLPLSAEKGLVNTFKSFNSNL